MGAIWFPLLLWTVISIIALVVLRLFKLNILYQYHIRVALIAGIPLSILASLLTKLSSASASAEPVQLSFIVIQNPISVTANTEITQSAIDWSDPYVWLGTATVILLIISLIRIFQLVREYISLYKFSLMPGSIPFKKLELLDKQNFGLASRFCPESTIAFSDVAEIPYTFGWKKPIIVIPSYLKGSPYKLNMVICHELMHIKHADFLVNGFIMIVKSLFWFHPLLYLFHRDVTEYREMSCDTEVLADGFFSRKKYAQLLFELAPRRQSPRRSAVSMSVNKSTLKKRISIMKTLATQNRPVRKSICYSVLLLLGISGLIACSDLETSGITNSELKQAQARIKESPTGNQPLYIIKEDTDLDGVAENEEIMPKTDNAKLTSIKPKYIRSITVLKGDAAIQRYGPSGANGVIILILLDKEKALSDLKPPPPPTNELTEEDFFVVVEKMPQLIGGLANLQQKIDYPKIARKAGIEGRVIVQFIVNEQGEVENPQIIRGTGGGCDKEVLRVVREAKFKPGTQRGKPVRVQYSLPFAFKLSSNETIYKESSLIYLESPKVDGKKFVVKNISTETPNTVFGIVFDAATGEPIAGANIVLKSTNTGTSTDIDGKFHIKNIAAGSQELIFSYIGYQTTNLKVNIN